MRVEKSATRHQKLAPRHMEQNGARHSGAGARHDSPFRFLGEFVREPLRVGSVWPSSKILSQLVVDCCEFKPYDTVVELGPGSGPFTGLLLKRLNRRGRLLAVELNATNAATLRRKFAHCEVIHDSAENLSTHMNGDKATCIVSGLAWGNMLPKTQNRIFKAILRSLSPGGQFVAFGYVHAAWFPTSLRFRRQLCRHFARV
jgi:phosphatidylethanolamine/phosphatidyl-N-methylethanolamine N-methyltransferase